MQKKIRILILSILIILALDFTVHAGELSDRVKRTTDKLIAIVTDADLMPMERDAERRQLIRDAVNEIFDWEAFSMRALGRHWRNRTDKEKKEFVALFGELLERTYMDKTRQYSGEKVNMLGEEIDGDYGVVKTEVILSNGKTVPVDYHAKKEDGKWYVYDIRIEGVSLVNNYRVQFNDILVKSSYDELVKRLKAKISSEE